jgi:hypothetical protein
MASVELDIERGPDLIEELTREIRGELRVGTKPELV